MKAAHREGSLSKLSKKPGAIILTEKSNSPFDTDPCHAPYLIASLLLFTQTLALEKGLLLHVLRSGGWVGGVTG